MNIEEIRRRHEADERGDPSFGVWDEQTHKDRAELLKKVEELEEEVETLRMQLAGCGVVAMSNTHESAKKAREMDQRYKCASIDDVAACVDREIMWRERAKKAEATLERVRALPDKWSKDKNKLPCQKDWDDGWTRAELNCADELDAALKGEGDA